MARWRRGEFWMRFPMTKVLMLSMHSRARLRPHLPGCGRARVPAEERDGSGTGGGGAERSRPAIRCWTRGWDGSAAATETAPSLSTRELEVLQLIVHGKSNKEIADRAGAEREHDFGASREYHADAADSQHGGAGGLRDPHGTGQHRMSAVSRRQFSGSGRGFAACRLPGAPLGFSADGRHSRRGY